MASEEEPQEGERNLQVGWGQNVEVSQSQTGEFEDVLWWQWDMVGSLILFSDVGRNANDPSLNTLDKWEWMRTERLLLCLEFGASVTSGKAMSTG